MHSTIDCLCFCLSRCYVFAHLQIEELEQTIQQLSINVDREEFERLKKSELFHLLNKTTKLRFLSLVSLSLSLFLCLSLSLSLLPLILCVPVSEMMTDEIESVREALANEKEERIKAELDAQEVCAPLEKNYTHLWMILLLIQAKSELAGVRQSLTLMEDGAGDENNKLIMAVAQVEELQKELTLEKEQRASKEASLAEEISQLQETEVAQENKSMLFLMHCGLCCLALDVLNVTPALSLVSIDPISCSRSHVQTPWHCDAG